MVLVTPFVSPLVGELSSGSSTSLPTEIQTITTEASTTPGATSANRIVLDSDHDAVAVWIGDRPPEEYYLNVYVNVGGTTSRIKAFRNSMYIINAAAGSTVSFGTTQRLKASFTGVASSTSIYACAFATPAALSAPSGASGTVNCDKGGAGSDDEHFWDPTAGHILLPDVNQEFIVGAVAGRRNIFISEHDGFGNWTPPRHIHLPDNTAVTVRCVNREIAVANYDGSTISITAPTGTLIGGTSTTWRPEFTVTGTSRTVGASSDGFGGDQGTAVQNLVYCLKSLVLASGDEIVIESGTYDLSGGSNPINATNYASPMGKSIRIRSSTGDPADVIFSGASWSMVFNSGVQWIIEGCTFSMNGLSPQSGASGVVDVQGGTLNLHNCIVTGANATANNAQTAVRSAAYATSHVFSFCTFTGSTGGDGVSVVSGTGLANLHLVGCTLDGNGTNGAGGTGANQVLTTHSGQVLEAFGCAFSDSSATGNITKISPALYTDPLYLFFCECLAADITNADGIMVQLCTGLYFCNFTKAAVFMSNGGYIVGCTVVEENTAVTREFFKWDKTDVWGLCAGNTFTAQTSSGDHCLDIRSNCEMFGNQMNGSSTNGLGLRCNTGSPISGSMADAVNNRFTTTSASACVDLGTSADIGMNLINNIFDGYSGVTMTIGASGANGSAMNNYGRRGTEPTNWDTRFPSNSGDTWSTSAAGLGADGTPTAAGNCDDEGTAPGYYGGCDRYGRPLWLGGTYVRGPVEIQEIKASALLFPAVR